MILEILSAIRTPIELIRKHQKKKKKKCRPSGGDDRLGCPLEDGVLHVHHKRGAIGFVGPMHTIPLDKFIHIYKTCKTMMMY